MRTAYAKNLQPGDVVVCPWGDNLDDRMTVRSVRKERGRRVAVRWTDDSESVWSSDRPCKVEYSPASDGAEAARQLLATKRAR